ncbi:MAG TPA: hypothetical protein VKB17_04570 [Thermoleophilaceae bacterium]|nr:hypothetical protein [Thermoleophilaceae bacterium]
MARGIMTPPTAACGGAPTGYRARPGAVRAGERTAREIVQSPESHLPDTWAL